ncbi:hypothetical protein [Paraburkholderia phytofirmans]|nr:hypothetical protein [Paraburkholderia phytofirmans]
MKKIAMAIVVAVTTLSTAPAFADYYHDHHWHHCHRVWHHHHWERICH